MLERSRPCAARVCVLFLFLFLFFYSPGRLIWIVLWGGGGWTSEPAVVTCVLHARVVSLGLKRPRPGRWGALFDDDEGPAQWCVVPLCFLPACHGALRSQLILHGGLGPLQLEPVYRSVFHACCPSRRSVTFPGSTVRERGLAGLWYISRSLVACRFFFHAQFCWMASKDDGVASRLMVRPSGAEFSRAQVQSTTLPRG